MVFVRTTTSIMSSLHCSSFASSKALPSSVERDGCRTATSSNFERRRFDCANNGCKRRTVVNNSFTTRTPVSRTNECRDDFSSLCFDDRGEEEEDPPGAPHHPGAAQPPPAGGAAPRKEELDLLGPRSGVRLCFCSEPEARVFDAGGGGRYQPPSRHPRGPPLRGSTHPPQPHKK